MRQISHLGSSAVNSLRGVIALGLLASGGLFPAVLLASPLLRCQISQGETTRVVDFKPVADPYTVEAIDVDGLFRFKAVVIGDTQHIEYIKLYVYGQDKRRPVLLQHAKYLAPVATSGAAPSALTGVIYVYAPPYERELQYGCGLVEQTP